jgi:hypothetical protein
MSFRLKYPLIIYELKIEKTPYLCALNEVGNKNGLTTDDENRLMNVGGLSAFCYVAFAAPS